MQRAIAAIAGLSFAALAGAQSAAVFLEPVEAVVTVTAVDLQARKVTVRGPKGNLQTFAVPKEARNLDKVKPGSRLRIAYAEALALTIVKSGEPSAKVEEIVQAGQKVRTVRVTAVVDAIDYKNRQVALRGPKGKTLSLPVSPQVKDFERIVVGDKVSIVYSEALAVKMEPD